VHECERTGGGLVLAMEHPEGPTLREVIKREGTLDLKRALVLAARLGEVLEGVHNLGLVHGGLRPENVVLVGPEERVVLKHLGFDWVLLSRSPDAGLHRESPREDRAYRAPEQAWEQATYRSDIYAFGAILYEMLAGAPAPATSRPRVYPGPLKDCRADVSPSLERIVMQALQVAPERRPTDISVVCNAVWAELTSEGQPTSQEPRTVAGPWAGKRMKKLLGWGATVLAVLAIWSANALITVERSSTPVPQSAPPAAAVLGAPSDGAVTSPVPADAPGTARTGLHSIPPTVAPPKPGESKRDRRITAPLGDGAAMAQRRDQPDVPRPQASPATRDDAGDDPGAIIDWLLNEGASKER
jgi:serine/threonine protein kinase